MTTNHPTPWRLEMFCNGEDYDTECEVVDAQNCWVFDMSDIETAQRIVDAVNAAEIKEKTHD